MSRIIKAADLQILVPSEAQTVIPAPPGQGKPQAGEQSEGIILDGSNLIKDAQRKAAEILFQAEEQARLAGEGLEAEREQVLRRGKEEGYEQGYAEGRRAGEAKAAEDAAGLLELLGNVLEEGGRARAAALAALEDDFLKLSLLLADKIVKKSVNDDVSWLNPIIREGLGALGSVEEIVILLNPVDYALIQEEHNSLRYDTRVRMRFESDPEVVQGGCLIESENGLIDARLEKRMGKLANHLLEVLYDAED